MKIEKTAPVKTFQPISIRITIESEEELKALQKMVYFDEAIPELVAMDRAAGYMIVKEFLQSINQVIYNENTHP